jgi:DHA2 family multidrug resistance protein
MTAAVYPDPASRRLITASTMLGSFIVTLDTTIANVALPHIQGSVSASQEEISWVLTSYIVASAICTPLVGWFAERFGRKQVMVVSSLAFTIMSVLCGVSQTLGELVAFRLLQGVAGAALVPLTQSILLDINPPEKHSSAMSMWGLASIMGPIIGPTVGGWLTDNFSWRWVFYINLPLGLAATAGLILSMPKRKRADQVAPFDLFGFGTMGMAIGCLQLMLDRGQTKDWFSSIEICIETAGVVLFTYLSIVHMLTARRPFIEPGLFGDRNFSIGT